MNNCEPTIGCKLPQNNITRLPTQSENKMSAIIFITDPICSHCWALEPVWRRLCLNYHFNYRYIHGGLLPGWQHFSDAKNGITKPSDVAQHWLEVAKQYKQPISPNVWLKDPIDNSIILCKALLAMRVLAPQLETEFLRGMREQIFLFSQNLAKEHNLVSYLKNFTVNIKDFKQLLADHRIHQLFLEEQQEMKRYQTRGFPSLVMLSIKPNVISGTRDYSLLKTNLLNCFPKIKRKRLTNLQKLNSYRSWTLRETTEVLQCDEEEAKTALKLAGFIAIPVANTQLYKKPKNQLSLLALS
jgi:protein-disulfide isomerase-like protein with CxxC motif